MELTISEKTLMVLAVYTLAVIIVQTIFIAGSTDMQEKFAPPEEITHTPDLQDIIGWLGLIWNLIAYVFSVIFTALTLGVFDMPIILKIIFLLPVWVAVGILLFKIIYIIAELVMKAVEALAKVLDAIIPF